MINKTFSFISNKYVISASIAGALLAIPPLRKKVVEAANSVWTACSVLYQSSSLSGKAQIALSAATSVLTIRNAIDQLEYARESGDPLDPNKMEIYLHNGDPKEAQVIYVGESHDDPKLKSRYASILNELLKNYRKAIVLVEGYPRGIGESSSLLAYREQLTSTHRDAVKVYGWDDMYAHLLSGYLIKNRLAHMKRLNPETEAQLFEQISELAAKRDRAIFETVKQLQKAHPNTPILVIAGSHHIKNLIARRWKEKNDAPLENKELFAIPINSSSNLPEHLKRLYNDGVKLANSENFVSPPESEIFKERLAWKAACGFSDELIDRMFDPKSTDYGPLPEYENRLIEIYPKLKEIHGTRRALQIVENLRSAYQTLPQPSPKEAPLIRSAL